MPKFFDSSNREYEIEFTCSVMKRVMISTEWQRTVEAINEEPVEKILKETVQLNLSDAATDDELFNKLAMNDVFMFDILYAICKPQCDAKEISQEEFGDALDGQHLEKARTAFWGALLDFFREHKLAILEARLAAGKEATNQTRKLRDSAAETMAKFATSTVEQSLATFGNTSTNLPELSESIPGP